VRQRLPDCGFFVSVVRWCL